MPKTTPPEIIQKIHALHDQGYSYDRIVAELSVGKQTVYKVLKGTTKSTVAVSKVEPTKETLVIPRQKAPFKLPVDVEVALMDILALRNFKNFQLGGTNQSKAKSLDTIATWLQSLRE